MDIGMLGAVIYIVYVCKNILAKTSLIFVDNTPPPYPWHGVSGEGVGRLVGGVGWITHHPTLSRCQGWGVG